MRRCRWDGFAVEVPGRVELKLDLFESRYRGLFGWVTGEVSPDGVAPVQVESALAMGERFSLEAGGWAR